jgi:hypothetical protein
MPRRKVALVACGHKLLGILNAMVRHNEPWDASRHRPDLVPLAKDELEELRDELADHDVTVAQAEGSEGSVAETSAAETSAAASKAGTSPGKRARSHAACQRRGPGASRTATPQRARRITTAASTRSAGRAT